MYFKLYCTERKQSNVVLIYLTILAQVPIEAIHALARVFVDPVNARGAVRTVVDRTLVNV